MTETKPIMLELELTDNEQQLLLLNAMQKREIVREHGLYDHCSAVKGTNHNCCISGQVHLRLQHRVHGLNYREASTQKQKIKLKVQASTTARVIWMCSLQCCIRQEQVKLFRSFQHCIHQQTTKCKCFVTVNVKHTIILKTSLNYLYTGRCIFF